MKLSQFSSATNQAAWEYGGVYISYIPQTEQHEPEGWMLFCLGNVTNLLDVTVTLGTQYYHPPILPSCYLSSKIWLLSNIQQSIMLCCITIVPGGGIWISKSSCDNATCRENVMTTVCKLLASVPVQPAFFCHLLYWVGPGNKASKLSAGFHSWYRMEQLVLQWCVPYQWLLWELL